MEREGKDGMTIDFEFRDDVCILRLKGRFATGADAEYLRTKTDELKKTGCRKVLADFSNVPYIDSTGIGFLVGIYTGYLKNTQGGFVLTNLNRRVREVLDLTRLSSILTISKDEQTALAWLHDASATAKHAEHSG